VINRPEAAATAKAVIECLSDPRYDGKTMGVICLQGHAQAQLIEQMLLDAVGPEPFEKRQLICGDAYSFQGVSRNDLNPECMRCRLLEYCYNPGTEVLSTDLSVCDSQFERDVATELISRAYRIVPQYPYAGKRIDLVVEGTKSRLAIEGDGDEWHGPDRYEADMHRQRILERAGWKFVRIRGSRFYASRQVEAVRVLAEIEAQEIEPVTKGDLEQTDRSCIGEVRGQDCLESLGGIEVDGAAKSAESTDVRPHQENSGSEPPVDDDVAKQEHVDHEEGSAKSAEKTRPSEATNDSTRSIEDQGFLLLGEPAANAEEASATAQPNGVRSEEQHTIDEIVAHGFETWLKLAHWAKVNDVLEPKERSLSYNVGDRIRRGTGPSFAQARWAKTIFERARELGFEMPEPNGETS